MRFPHYQWKVAGIVALLAAFVVGLVGCGSSGGGTTGGTETGKPAAFEPEIKGGITGALLPDELKLWKYDKGNGKYEVVAGDASKPFKPEIAKFPAGTKLGYIDPWAANPFAIPIREGFEQLGKEYGFEIAYCDAAFKPEKAVECAEQVASQNPAFVVAGNWQVGAAPAMMAVLDEAKIPAEAMDVAAPNAVFLGANNYVDGVLAGKEAGKFAEKEWSCDEVWLLLGENPAEGEAPDLRLQGFEDGVQEVCGEISDDQVDRILMSAGTADQALTATTDWLTAHPQAKHILGASYDDERGSGIAKSFAQATETEAFAVGFNCDTVGIETAHQAAPEDNHFLGCVAFFPEKYPELLVGIAQQVIDGKAVPNENHTVSKFLTHDTISQYYPK